MIPLVAILLCFCLSKASSQSTFQCGDGNYSFQPVANGRDCPCTTDDFLEFVNLGCPIPSSVVQNDGTIYLAGLLDLSSYWWTEDIFHVTVDQYNKGFFKDVNGIQLNKRLLIYELADSKCDETTAIREWWRLRTQNDGVPPDGVIGTRCSGSALSLARQLGVEGVPQVSPGATSAKLSDNERYPEFSRMVAPQDERGEASAMVTLLRAFGWDEIAILSTDKSFSQDWETSLRKLWIGSHNDASGVWNGEVVYSDNFRLDAAGENIDQNSIEQTLANFPKKKVRVIVLLAHNTDAFKILKTASETNFQPDTVWVGPASWIGRDDLDHDLTWLPKGKPPGWIGLTPFRNNNSYANAFKEQLDMYHLSQGKEPWPELPVYAAETVDSIALLAHAVDLARDQPGGGDVTSILRSIVYEPGVSGHIEFTEIGDRKDPSFTVLSMGSDGNWINVGTSSTGAATANIDISSICWASYGCGVAEAPADTFPQPKVKLPSWAVAVLVIVFIALFVLALKYWRSTQSKKKLKTELAKLQKSIIGMRAAKITYIPSVVLDDESRRTSIESKASPRVSTLMSSASSQSNQVDTKVQWCWEETKSYMNGHDPSNVFGDPSDCWIKYDNFYNDILEKAFQRQNGKGTVTLDPLDYVVDLEAKTQTKKSTGFIRSVMRWQDITTKTASITSGTDADSIDAQISDFPSELCGEPQMVLVPGDVVQVSKQRDDGWAFGTKLFHADEEIVLEFVKVATASDDAEKGNDTDVCADTGWFPLDWATRSPTADDLAGLQKNVSDTGELEAPSHWDPVKDPLIVQRHKLDANGQEYQKVSNAFLSTLKARKTKIVGIDRIQNMGMWQSYVVKRQTICYRETELDRPKALQRFEKCWLWHGTNREVYEKIIQQGFNRSFCGKNATMWGKGVYFARDAEYSSREVYSVPDSKGIKYIMACRVMVGEYCRGRTDAITPDVRCAKTHSLYDSTVDRMNNPGIYVTYHDAQAYPEYIIRFKFLD